MACLALKQPIRLACYTFGGYMPTAFTLAVCLRAARWRCRAERLRGSSRILWALTVPPCLAGQIGGLPYEQTSAHHRMFEL